MRMKKRKMNLERRGDVRVPDWFWTMMLAENVRYLNLEILYVLDILR